MGAPDWVPQPRMLVPEELRFAVIPGTANFALLLFSVGENFGEPQPGIRTTPDLETDAPDFIAMGVCEEPPLVERFSFGSDAAGPEKYLRDLLRKA